MKFGIIVGTVYTLLFIVFMFVGLFVPDPVMGPVFPVFFAGFCFAMALSTFTDLVILKNANKKYTVKQG